MKQDTCPDCGVPLGRKHEEWCDVQRCPHCGGQALGCVGFDPNDPGREPWTGKWPGEADCERLGYFVNDDRDFPDLDRLFRECDWNRERQRWEDRFTRAEGETVH
jgi:hypothetical protein